MTSIFKILLLVFVYIAFTIALNAQNDSFEKEVNVPPSFLDTLLADVQLAQNTIEKRLTTLDSLFKTDKISNSEYLFIGRQFLTLREPKAYTILLSNATKFSFQRMMSVNDIAKGGKIWVLDVALRTCTLDDKKALLNFVFHSNYLNKKIPTEDLAYLKTLFGAFRHQYRHKYRERDFTPQKEKNLDIILSD